MIIGIGASTDPDKVLASVRAVRGDAEIVCYAPPGFPEVEDLPIRRSQRAEEALVSDLMAGRIQAAVRGTLPANSTLRLLKEKSGATHLSRIALLESADGTRFLLAPVGVDEGWTVQSKLEFIEKGRSIAKRFGLPERVAVLSGGRYGDIGRSDAVDRSLADAELVARLSGAEHREILIEDAIGECGLIIAPDGITGNLIFRTLVFLGGGKGHGAPVVNIDKIFVDTSRASPDYRNALLLAIALAKN
ncbi:MAG TPA: methanogenesis marker protein Mmp4/MtxX [Methanomicrobiales archaeon]|nr:methanogenesis marker protein Mmp4/MtxX [Methanomicrobiales archaeon]